MMNQGKHLTISFIISSAFLLASTSAFADYSQTQDRIDDKENSSKQSKPHSSSKKKDDENKSGQNSSDRRDISTDGPRGDAVEKTPSEIKTGDPARTDNKGNY